MFLKVQNASIGYEKDLISNINFELNLGDVCLLIGNNGVGKTTFIKSILNQIPLRKGSISIEGTSHQQKTAQEIAEQIAVVFSKAQIPNHYNVTDLVSFGKYIHYPYYFQLTKEDQKEVENTIRSLKLESYAHTPISELSDGNLQKAFIGRALLQNSPFIILDEPTTHLDEENKIMILSLLRNLAKEQNKLILFSSHDWRLAKDFADKMLYLKNNSASFGITEEILLHHSELIKPVSYIQDSPFKAPQISSPKLEAELLISYLQKNTFQDLSHLHFTLNNAEWSILRENEQHRFKSFEEIKYFILNHH